MTEAADAGGEAFDASAKVVVTDPTEQETYDDLIKRLEAEVDRCQEHVDRIPDYVAKVQAATDAKVASVRARLAAAQAELEAAQAAPPEGVAQ